MKERNGIESAQSISCNVIQDLLPSYVDEVCSKDTQVLVREHIAECQSCRQKLERMQDTEVVAEKLQKREIDYLKKFKRERVGAVMLCAFVLVKVWISCVYNRIGNENLIGGVSVCATLLLLFAVGVAGNYKVTVEKGRMIKEIALSAFLFLLQAGLNEYVLVYCLSHDKKVFFIEISRIGPVMVAFYVSVMLAEGLLLLVQAMGGHKNAYAAVLYIAGLNLAGATIGLMYRMETLTGHIRQVHLALLTQLIFIVAGTAVLLGYHSWTAKKES